MKYCPYCGAGLQDSMIFCPKCGKKFQDAVESAELSEHKSISVDEILPETTQKEEITVSDAAKGNGSVIFEAETKRTTRRKPVIIILALLCLLSAAIAFTIYVRQIPNEENIDIAEASNSVLYLEVYDDSDNITATASGFAVEDGTVLVTNYHVIEDAYHIVARTADNEECIDVSNILAYDENADLALLKCDADIGIVPLILGDSSIVKQGDSIYVIGYPLGLANTLSDGVISSRYMDENGVDILQITAAISHGSSGGALLNDHGEVIGVICASYTDGQNLNIAISSNEIQSLMDRDAIPIAMKEFYASQSRIGINAFNLAQSASMTRSGDYFFYEPSMRDRTIYCHKIGEVHADMQVAKGSCCNAYMGRLYYYDRDQNKISSCDFNGKDKNTVNLTPDVIQDTNYYISDMLIAYDRLYFTVCNFGYLTKSNITTDFYIYDLKSGTQIDSLKDVCNFSYYKDNLYIALRGGGIAEVNMKTYDTQVFETSCSPWIRGISDDGKVYYVDEYNFLENGFFYIDISIGEEIRNPNYTGESGWGSYYDIFVVGNTVYLAISHYSADNKLAYETYRIENDGSLHLLNDSVWMAYGGCFPELNCYYASDNGATVDLDTGAVIGTWVFER